MEIKMVDRWRKNTTSVRMEKSRYSCKLVVRRWSNSFYPYLVSTRSTIPCSQRERTLLKAADIFFSIKQILFDYKICKMCFSEIKNNRRFPLNFTWIYPIFIYLLGSLGFIWIILKAKSKASSKVTYQQRINGFAQKMKAYINHRRFNDMGEYTQQTAANCFLP